MALSEGQDLALSQLEEISEYSEGTLEIVAPYEERQNGQYIRIPLSIRTEGYSSDGGLKFRSREPIKLCIWPNFPFDRPSVWFRHARFLGAPHVQWGNYICLYISPEVEWIPADGLYGFFERLDDWFRAAGQGELDPDDAPLHPPVAYTSSNTQFVFHVDTPSLSDRAGPWLGYATLNQPRIGRLDVSDWTSIEHWGENETPKFIAATILLNCPLPMEYPKTINGLIDALERCGVTLKLLFPLLKAFAHQVPSDSPMYFVLGAPMRRKAAGLPLRQHLTVWEIEKSAVGTLQSIIREKANEAEDIKSLAHWMVTAKVLWCRTFENRPEVTNRRDHASKAERVRGKRVLLLGCGAIGSKIAEDLVRAEVSSLTVVDNGVVTPGLLVRQRYKDEDVGLPKAVRLAKSLSGLGLSGNITPADLDMSREDLRSFDLSNLDLIIDATASQFVSHKIEQFLAHEELSIPLISTTVNANATFGSISVRMPAFTGGPLHIGRRAKLVSFKNHPDHPVTKAFWPDKSQLKYFQPEPGCSDPTFTGSAADLSSLSSAMLNVGLARIGILSHNAASTDFIVSPWTLGDCDSLNFQFSSYPDRGERRHGYRVFKSTAAGRRINAELRHIARTKGKDVETGGLIFGEIDESHKVIFIDSVSGPPPDSEMTPQQFRCGTLGTAELAAAKRRQSGDSSRFIGIWHSHPLSKGRPSTEDLRAMVELLHFQRHKPRQILMAIVGFSATNPTPEYYLFRRRDIQFVTPEDFQALSE